MNRKDIIQRLQQLNIAFSKKSNTQKLLRKLENSQQTIAIKAFRLLDNGKLATGGIGGSTYTEFEEGKTYQIDNDQPLKLCKNGFHFYRIEDTCFGANLFKKDTVLHKIIAYGEVISDTEKCAARKIKICERIELKLDKNYNSGNWNSGSRNPGDYNSGHWNSGDYNSGHENSGSRNSGDYNPGNYNSGNRNSGNSNSGHWNSGSYNSGNWNSGSYNSGNWNSCSGETGYLNTEESEIIRIFNRPCLRIDWEKAKIPNFFCFRRSDSYKKSWQESWENTTESDRRLVEELPNFDWKVFTELTGIEKPEDWE